MCEGRYEAPNRLRKCVQAYGHMSGATAQASVQGRKVVKKRARVCEDHGTCNGMDVLVNGGACNLNAATNDALLYVSHITERLLQPCS